MPQSTARSGLVAFFGAAALATASGCAREAPPPQAATAPYAVAHYEPSSEIPASWYETPRAAPRLSQVVRIGADDAAYTDARIYVERPQAPPAAAAPPTPTYGYGYGYGYFGYGIGRGGYGAAGRSFSAGAPRPVGSGDGELGGRPAMSFRGFS